MKKFTELSLVLMMIMSGSALVGLGMCSSMPVKPEVIEEEPPTPRGKPIIVAVIDTGFDFGSDWKADLKNHPTLKKPKMCKYGHKDFTETTLMDNHGHGTHVSGLIAKYAGDTHYCIVMLKFYDKPAPIGVLVDNLGRTAKALQRAIDLKVDIINFSGGGPDRSDRECTLVKKALDMGITVVLAAGNEKSDINKSPYYPAMCDIRTVAVAAVDLDDTYLPSSNYTNNVELNSRPLYRELGKDVLSLKPHNYLGYLTGTSQAAAIRTGKILRDWKKP